MLKKLFYNEKGFTMVEMMVVLVIISVLIAGSVKFYLGYVENARVIKARAQISIMQASLDAYYAENARYPTDNKGLLNAGIKTTGVSLEIEAADPWGLHYVYAAGSANPNIHYVLHTGCAKVQGVDDTYVAGEGAGGSVLREPEITPDISADGIKTE